MSAPFTSEQIRIGHALWLCESHCLACCQLYGAGRRPDALLQAARPMTDVFPWLETELRSHPRELKEFITAVAAIGTEVRRDARPRVIRRGLKRAVEAREALVGRVAAHAARSDPYRVSVGIVLLGTLRDLYAKAVESAELSAYQSSYGVARTAIELLEHGRGRGEGPLATELDALAAAFASVDPPEQLVRPEELERLIDRMSAVAAEEMGARPMKGGLDDALAKVDRLLDDVVESYERGVAPLSARLAASLFVRSYDPIREELARHRPEDEAKISQLLGVDLRRGINDGLPVEEIRRMALEARGLLRAAGGRETPPE